MAKRKLGAVLRKRMRTPNLIFLFPVVFNSTSRWSSHEWSSTRKEWQQHSWQDDKWSDQRWSVKQFLKYRQAQGNLSSSLQENIHDKIRDLWPPSRFFFFLKKKNKLRSRVQSDATHWTRRRLYTEYTSWSVPQHTFSWAHTAPSVAQDKDVPASFTVTPHAHSLPVSLMSLLNVKFTPFPSLLFSPSASSSRAPTSLPGHTRSWCQTPSAPACRRRESGRFTDAAPNTLWATDLHRCQLWAHADHLLLEERQHQHREQWPYQHSRSPRELRQYSSASGSQRWPAASTSKCGKPMAWRRHVVQRCSESLASVEGTLSRGKRDRDWESVQTLSERRNLHVYLEQKAEFPVQGECAAQRRLSEAEADMNIRNWEQRNSDIALYETNRELESQRFELYQANQWADQAQREEDNLCGEFDMRNQTLPRESRKKLPGITKNLLRRNR